MQIEFADTVSKHTIISLVDSDNSYRYHESITTAAIIMSLYTVIVQRQWQQYMYQRQIFYCIITYVKSHGNLMMIWFIRV